MLREGAIAPEFTVPGADGESIEQYHLTDYTDAGAVVLVFYPFDFSPVCTEELCNFRDSEWLTFTADLDVFGISTDSAYAHQAVIQENDLPFPLLSDHAGEVCEQFDALYDELEEHPRVSKRAIAVIDDSDTVRWTWEAEDYTTDPNIADVHEAIQSLDSIGV